MNIINDYIGYYIVRVNNWYIFRKLKREGLSDREIAESYIFPSPLSPKKKRKSLETFKAWRAEQNENPYSIH